MTTAAFIVILLLVCLIIPEYASGRSNTLHNVFVMAFPENYLLCIAALFVATGETNGLQID